MTQEEIQEYNKRCALFLGAISNKHKHCFYPMEDDELNLSFYIFDESIFSNNEGSTWKIKDLKFDSDYNWIMEVVEEIEKIKDGQGYRWRVDTYLESCSISNTHNFTAFITINSTSKKEAVVQAINQFLIWYNENNK